MAKPGTTLSGPVIMKRRTNSLSTGKSGIRAVTAKANLFWNQTHAFWAARDLQDLPANPTPGWENQLQKGVG